MSKVFFFLLFFFSLSASAQKMLKRPLAYVPADSVIVLPRGESNIIADIMAVDPYLNPKDIVLTKAEKKTAKKGHLLRYDKMLLLTGEAVYADTLEERFFRLLPPAINDGILPVPERQSAAQEALDLTGTIFATNGKDQVYVNFYENCTARITTKAVHFLLDVISEYPDGPEVKLRIGGLPAGQTAFSLHLRIPSWAEGQKFFINGREIVSPIIANGYLVVSRKWRNNEELFFYAKD